MATGRTTLIQNPGVYEQSTSSQVTTVTCGYDPAGGAFRVFSLFITGATGAINTPSGLTKVYDSVVDGSSLGTMRNAVFFAWGNTSSVAFTWTTSGYGCVMSNQWDGVDTNDPFLLLPSSSTIAGGGAATSLSIPSLVPPDGSGVGVWYWGMNRTSGTETAVALPASLVSAGYGGQSTGTGFRARSGFWGTASAPYSGFQTPNPTGAMVATTASSGSGNWRGVGLVLRPKNRGRFLPCAGARVRGR